MHRALVVVALLACSTPPATNPHGRAATGGMPIAEPTAPRTLAKTADGKRVLGPFALDVPDDWREQPVTSSMRAAQFVLPPGKAGAPGDAELVVYYFGEGGAGSIEANLERWIGQFSQPDGKPSRDVAKTERLKLAGQDATVVSVTGRYQTSMMPGGPAPVDRADQMLLGAIVGSPSGPYYFKLVGPTPTVEAHAARFRAMLSSMKLR